MKRTINLSILALLFTTQVVMAQDFDRTLLNGVWAESTNYQFGCRSENLHQRLELAKDGKTLTFMNDRDWQIGTGQKVRQYTASVMRSSVNVLVIRYGPELANIPDNMREWEMRFIGPGTYLWRATAWPPNQFNEVIGVKCEP
ncbi:MAG: hypothetical protein RL722_15 [Pseudomonadota bacterium]|jgi:hypothetical protein